MAMIIMTLKKYGSQPGSTRTSLTLGVGNRNTLQGFERWDYSSSLEIRLKITTQLLARKFEREILMLRRSVEEDTEREVLLLLVFAEGRKMWNEDNKGRQSLAAVGDKGGRNSTTAMHGLGLGFVIELKIFYQR